MKNQFLEETFVLMELNPGRNVSGLVKLLRLMVVSFKVENNIPRCVAINLKPQTGDNSFNLHQLLKKNYNHFEMGIYLTALDDGEINVGNSIHL